MKAPAETVRQQTNGMTSTILLTLAKRFQDNVLGGMALPGSGGTLRVSTSVIILLYYLALAWSPAPSTFNNLGIVLSGITDGRTGADGELLDGMGLARTYYTAGLQLDPKHPHLLTNLGSLLKDQGQTEQAIKMYMKAVEQKPDFDIALANLGNAIKDVWPSRAAAKEWFAQRWPWSRWDPRVLDLYVEHALCDMPTAAHPDLQEGVTLSTTREQEAWGYSGYDDAHASLERLKDLCPAIPVHSVFGDDRLALQTAGGAAAIVDETVGRRMRSIVRVAQSGHLIVQENPRDLALALWGILHEDYGRPPASRAVAARL
ncbi:hypothetical protein NUW54_g11954 [Trametes sanguinea]|uniref:Uncharacterized protein n=1 Tax=Trametes sanguinea TaxID=158606 RepID=A0ACC1N448_9APHY|nr:hypothetical protein NUW54_g11954 [Trametes sanguinea]